MTQPAKGQEPTMEEILASIRRIIADEPANEPSRGPALRKEMPRNDVTRVESPLNQNTRRENPRPESPSYEARASLHSTEWRELPTGRTQPFVDPHSRLEPSTSETPDHELDAALAEPRSDSYEQPEAIEQPAQDIFDTEQTDAAEYLPEAELSADEQVHAEEQEAEAAEPHPVIRAGWDVDRHGGGPLRSPDRAAVRQAGREAAEESLISAATTAAVDSAFNTLAQTVLVQNGRTLEDLVRELLRPMLKTWLDDNLPNLVERLVRAEIERVSRGR
jgi:cell pole-organizing protein PopZ